MPVELIPLSGTELIPRDFLERWDFLRKRDESRNAKEAASLAKKHLAKITVLTLNGVDLGFVATSILQLPGSKCYHLQILYLFVSKNYRGNIRLPELGDLNSSEFLLGWVIGEAIKASTVAPFCSIILQTATDKLVPLYSSFDFTSMISMPHSWMSLPISADNSLQISI